MQGVIPVKASPATVGTDPEEARRPIQKSGRLRGTNLRSAAGEALRQLETAPEQIDRKYDHHKGEQRNSRLK